MKRIMKAEAMISIIELKGVSESQIPGF